jgi:hypothetical protein
MFLIDFKHSVEKTYIRIYLANVTWPSKYLGWLALKIEIIA